MHSTQILNHTADLGEEGKALTELTPTCQVGTVVFCEDGSYRMLTDEGGLWVCIWAPSPHEIGVALQGATITVKRVVPTLIIKENF